MAYFFKTCIPPQWNLLIFIISTKQVEELGGKLEFEMFPLSFYSLVYKRNPQLGILLLGLFLYLPAL